MTSYSYCLLFLFFSALATTTCGERILFLTPLASRSHIHVFEPLIRALGEKGHELVVLSPIKSSDMPPTVRQVQVITTDDLFGNMKEPFSQRREGFASMLTNMSTWDPMRKACEKVYQSPVFQHLLRNETFDLVIVNIIPNLCLLGVVPHFKAMSIYITTFAAPPIISNMVGNRLPPSFVPALFLENTDKMSFPQRMVNTIFEFFVTSMWDAYIGGKSERLYRKYLPNGEDLPGIHEIQKNVSMIFMNCHFTLTYPRPLLPDVIEIGGVHTRPAKKLPKDLDDFLTGSGNDGFIYFSLGSIVKTENLPERIRKVFVNVFGKLKQRVLWKWSNETMPDLPKNVKLSKWLPQQDILGHRNIKLFMSHGGLLSTQESVYHGVPVLGLPIFGDQDLNIRQAEKNGYAKFLEIFELTEESLEAAILELIHEPKYKEKVKTLSQRFRDVPQNSLEKAVYWTEYVLRHKGAAHIKSSARHLNFFQYYVIDVFAAFLVLFTISIFVALRCCKLVFRSFCGARKGHIKKSINKMD